MSTQISRTSCSSSWVVGSRYRVNHVTILSSVLICIHLYIEEEKSPFVTIYIYTYLNYIKRIITKHILVGGFNPSDKHISPIISLHICIFHKDLWIKHYHLSLNFSQISVQTSRASIFSPMFPCGVKDVGEMLAFIMLPWNLSCLIMSVASIRIEKMKKLGVTLKAKKHIKIINTFTCLT